MNNRYNQCNIYSPDLNPIEEFFAELKAILPGEFFRGPHCKPRNILDFRGINGDLAYETREYITIIASTRLKQGFDIYTQVRLLTTRQVVDPQRYPKRVEPSLASNFSISQRTLSIYSPAPLSFMISAIARWTSRSWAGGRSIVRRGLRVSERMMGNKGSPRKHCAPSSQSCPGVVCQRVGKISRICRTDRKSVV